jgi:hypothetical protein
MHPTSRFAQVHDRFHAQERATLSSACSVVVVVLLHLGLGRCTSLAAALLLLNDGNSRRDEFDTTVTAVGTSMELAVVVEVVLPVELVLAAELAREAVGALTMETKFRSSQLTVTQQMCQACFSGNTYVCLCLFKCSLRRKALWHPG